MAMNQDLAKEIARRFQEASSLCNSSLRTVMSNEGLGQVEVYGRLVGYFMGNAFSNVIAPIWKKYPELEPEHMKEPYVKPVPILTQESQQALRAFLAEAQAAMELVRSSVSPDESQEIFAFDGIAEVEDTIAAISSFLENPYFRDERQK